MAALRRKYGLVNRWEGLGTLKRAQGELFPGEERRDFLENYLAEASGEGGEERE